MTQDQHEVGSRQGSIDESSHELFFAEVAFHGDTRRLARLLVDDLEQRENWFEGELGPMLKHQLGAPIEPTAPGPGRSGAPPKSRRNTARLTFRDVMFGEAASVSTLRRIKNFAKAQLGRKDATYPAEIARVLYYGSVLAARCRCGERISTLTDAECLTGVNWVLEQTAWIDPETLAWFRSHRHALKSPG